VIFAVLLAAGLLAAPVGAETERENAAPHGRDGLRGNLLDVPVGAETERENAAPHGRDGLRGNLLDVPVADGIEPSPHEGKGSRGPAGLPFPRSVSAPHWKPWL
jgi:hypothetical protein